MAIATSTLGLVPQRRLGALLSERRDFHGYTVKDMARRSMGRFTEDDLEAIEAGTTVLDDAAIESLSLVYEVNSTPPAPQRSRLIIAEEEDLPFVMGTDEFGHGLVASVLRRYVALLYILRNLPIGDPLPLRADDAAMLAEAFDKSEADIRSQVDSIVVDEVEVVSQYASRMRRRLVVPAAGMLVGPTPAGMLVLVK